MEKSVVCTFFCIFYTAETMGQLPQNIALIRQLYEVADFYKYDSYDPLFPLDKCVHELIVKYASHGDPFFQGIHQIAGSALQELHKNRDSIDRNIIRKIDAAVKAITARRSYMDCIPGSADKMLEFFSRMLEQINDKLNPQCLQACWDETRAFVVIL